jgi:hypothetical protein
MLQKFLKKIGMVPKWGNLPKQQEGKENEKYTPPPKKPEEKKE